MKKALAIVVALLLIVWVLSWFRNPEAVATSGAKPWPGGMGTLELVAERYPAIEQNDAAKRLTALAQKLSQDTAIDAFVARGMARDAISIGAGPAVPEVAGIRELLLRERVVWGRPAGVADIGDQETSARRGTQMTMARTLIASALTKARADDAAAWDDLQAVWNLARSLEDQPQLMSQTAALAMVRMVNALAWKMPLPAPEWFAGLQARDGVRPLLEAFQYQTASYWGNGGSLFPNKWQADGVEHDRLIAEGLSRETRCDVSAPVNKHGSDLTQIWRRAFRYRAEREATANALRIREGKPIEESSVCSDGSWSFDGKTLRFSRTIETAPPDTPMPLVLQFASAQD